MTKKHVFLSYCHDNAAEVTQLYHDLMAAGESVWWDRHILPGEDWKYAIRQAMENAYAVVFCFSKETEARTESGIYPEVLDAIAEFRGHAPGSIFLIPVRLSVCKIRPIEIDSTRTLDRLQYVDLFPASKRADSLTRLVKALQAAPNHPRQPKLLDGVKVRSRELEKLVRLIDQDKCRLIILHGSEGIGKKTLATEVAERQEITKRLQVIRYSLRSRPSLQSFVAEVTSDLGEGDFASSTGDIRSDILSTRLVSILEKHRCLVILDDYDRILQDNGSYMTDYEGYASVLKHVVQAQHDCCLFVTSRIVPTEVHELANRRVQKLELRELVPEDGRTIMESLGSFSGSDEDWIKLTGEYRRPIYLVILAKYITDAHGGDIHRFLEENRSPPEIKALLDEQWKRLSKLQRDIIYWLAIDQEPVDPDDLSSDLLDRPSSQSLSEAIEGLMALFPIKRTPKGLISLERFVLDYLTEKLIAEACEEITRGELRLLQSHAFMKAKAKDYIRDDQKQRIVSRLLNCLKKRMLNNAQRHLKQCVERVPRLNRQGAIGYGAGNLLNLLLELGCNLNRYNFSRRFIRGADLRRVGQLRGVNFRGCHFYQTEFLEPLTSVLSVAFDPKRNIFASGHSDGTVYMWTWEGIIQDVLDAHKSLIWALAFGPNGELATGGADRLINVFDVGNDGILSRDPKQPPLQAQKDEVLAIAWAPDGKLISGGRTGKIQVWDTTRRELQLIDEWRAHEHMLHCLCFSPKGDILATASSDGTAKLWTFPGKEHSDTLKHGGPVYTVAFDPKGERVVTGGKNNEAKIWDTSQRPAPLIQTLEEKGHKGAVSSVVFFDDGRQLATASHDTTIKLWRSDDGVKWYCHRTLTGHISGINRLAVKTQHPIRLYSGGEDQAIRLWDLETGKCLQLIVGYVNWINAVRFIDEHTLASGSDDHMIGIWNLNNRKLEDAISAESGRVNYLAVSQDGQYLASGSDDGKVRIWYRSQDLSRRGYYSPGRHDGSVICLAFNPMNSAMVASIGGDGKVRIWEKNKDRTVPLPASVHQGAVAFNPNGRMLAFSQEDGSIVVWDIDQEEKCTSLPGHQDCLIHSLAFSFDGDLLASSADDCLIKLWDPNNGDLKGPPLKGHEKYVTDLAFHPFNRLLVSSSGDGRVRVWDTTSRDSKIVGKHERPVHSVAFSPRGTTLASAGADELIKVWRFRNGEFSLDYELPLPKPYEGMKIGRAIFVDERQRSLTFLRKLGATDGD